ncbi:helix-turn-helix transcriptional regulator [Nocardioides sp. InS609-2]|uniref:helix-turn-helix domain-containing protein n=1 Tax=Nocardioides sp. InS609-2 TaxID=2760705 RepID=UPI0024A62408|nr:helix-turn-helix transcriptional regulator [Nocardioides sp. InS609-2]
MGEVIAFPDPSAESARTRPEPLWREQVGRALRQVRLAADLRLVDVAERSGVSPQYLSEVERGLKDPSSEILAALSGALGLRTVDVASRAVEANGSGHGSGSYDGPVCLAA